MIVLIRDLRPKSVSAWVAQNAESKSARRKVTAERRLVEIGVGSQILRTLGVSDMVLLTNAPPSRYVGLEAFGLHIVGQRRLELRHHGRPVKAIRRDERASGHARRPGSAHPHHRGALLRGHLGRAGGRRDRRTRRGEGHLRAHRRAGRARDTPGAGAGREGGPDRLGRCQRPLRRLRRARLRHPRRDLALRHRLQQRQPLADAGRRRATPSRSATPSLPSTPRPRPWSARAADARARAPTRCAPASP